MIEIVTLAKHGGPLTKRITLDPNGKLISDGSACVMGSGVAWRTAFADMTTFAGHIAALDPSEAIALGRLRADLPDKVEVTTKAKLNGAPPGTIARSAEYIAYQPTAPGLLLVDYDDKGMPPEIRNRLAAMGGFVQALGAIVPEIANVGLVVRRSTSAGLVRTDTGQEIAGSDGRHLYVLIENGADAERALKALHDRCWLAGLGWMLVGAAGQLLERSIVDRMVFGPERLVFEGAPVLDPPLVQDQVRRRPRPREGAALNTAAAIPSINLTEDVHLRRLKRAAADALAVDVRKVRLAFIKTQTERLINERGVMPETARQTVERMITGILLPDLDLPFDLPEFAGKTVADVLADPDLYVGATLADPLEGVAYGTGKARIEQREDGSIWIHSFAHGRTVYDLKLDADMLRAVLAKTPDKEVIARFVRFARRMADVEGYDYAHIKCELIERLKLGVREFNRQVKRAEAVEAEEDRKAREKARQAQRLAAGDHRPQIRVPAEDTPRLEIIQQLDRVFAASMAAEPPMRNLEGWLTMALARRVPGMHQLTASGANAEENPSDRLPAPEHVLLTTLTEIEVAILVEKHIDYLDPTGRSVCLPLVFIKAYHQQRTDSPLPVVTAVATMPVILPDGTMLSGHRLDRERRILFRVDERLEALLPKIKECTPDAVAAAVSFLVDDWLVDVPTDYPGKLKLLTLAITILERGILPARPAFFITSGQRGNGKTTVIVMISVAALGEAVSAAAWSNSADERRKALLAYYGEGVPLICWDNIKRGATISCPSIEKGLTAETYTDRVLGVSESRTVPATSIICFTGNNIAPKGDMASRDLTIRLTTDRADPENRSFTHSDPIAWTYAHRGKILHALYTIMLGNPRLTERAPAEAETRFKDWWHLIGSALEHAARCHLGNWDLHAPECPPSQISFREEFLTNDAEDEQGHAVATVLRLLRGRWPGTFRASDILAFTNNSYDQDAPAFAEEFFPALEEATEKAPLRAYSSTYLSSRLRSLRDAPVMVDGVLMVLRYSPHPEHGGLFSVEVLP